MVAVGASEVERLKLSKNWDEALEISDIKSPFRIGLETMWTSTFGTFYNFFSLAWRITVLHRPWG